MTICHRVVASEERETCKTWRSEAFELDNGRKSVRQHPRNMSIGRKPASCGRLGVVVERAEIASALS
jgi:hypothetical protein